MNGMKSLEQISAGGAEMEQNRFFLVQNGEKKLLADVLNIQGEARNMIEQYCQNGYVFMGKKENGEYPCYFKEFYEKNKELFIGAKEVTRSVLAGQSEIFGIENTNEDELIFIQFPGLLSSNLEEFMRISKEYMTKSIDDILFP